MSKAPSVITSADLFEALRRRLAGKPNSTILAAAIGELAEVKSSLQARHAELSQERSASLLTADPAALAKSRAALDAIADQLDVAGAWRAKLAEEHGIAAASEEDARRRKVYDAAAEKVTAATKSFRREYERTARSLVTAVASLMAAKIAAADANAALPTGAEALPDPEMVLTCIPGEARKILKEETIELWCFVDSFNPVAQQHRVATGGPHKDRGYLPPESSRAAGNIEVVKRSFLRREVLPQIDARWTEAVTRTLCIPGWVSPPMRGPFAIEPSLYLATLDETLQAQDAAPPPPAKRKPVLEFVPIDGNGEVREDQILRDFEAQAARAA